MVHGAGGGAEIAVAGGVDAEEMAEEGDTPGLVDGGGGHEAITEMATNQRRVLGKPAGDVAVHPATAVLQGAWQVPVIESGEGFQAALQHAVEQAVVEVETRLVHRTGALGDESRPGKGEAVGVEAAVADEIEVRGPAVVVIAGDGAGVGVFHVAGGGGEAVPDGGAAAVGLATLDLVGCGNGAEDETGA